MKARGLKSAAKWVFHYGITPIVPYMPLKLVYAVATLLGRINYRVSAENRNKIRANLVVAFPEKSPVEIEAIVLANFVNHAKYSLEILLIPRLGRHITSRQVEIRGLEHVHQALSQGKGLIFAVGHMGIFYIAGVIMERYGCIMNDLAQDISLLKLSDIDRKILEKRLSEYQSAISGQIMYKGNFLRDLMQCLKRNECLSLFVDAKASTREELVPFLGKNSYLQPGAVTLAMKTGCTVLPTVTLRTPGDRWLIAVSAPIEMVAAGDKDMDIRANLGGIASLLEGWIRQHPEQWHLWREFHLRWEENRPEAAFRPATSASTDNQG